jgi:hypothetical protein
MRTRPADGAREEAATPTQVSVMVQGEPACKPATVRQNA